MNTDDKLKQCQDIDKELRDCAIRVQIGKEWFVKRMDVKDGLFRWTYEREEKGKPDSPRLQLAAEISIEMIEESYASKIQAVHYDVKAEFERLNNRRKELGIGESIDLYIDEPLPPLYHRLTMEQIYDIARKYTVTEMMNMEPMIGEICICTDNDKMYTCSDAGTWKSLHEFQTESKELSAKESLLNDKLDN